MRCSGQHALSMHLDLLRAQRAEVICRDALLMHHDALHALRAEFMDRDVDTSPIAPALAAFFDDVLDQSVEQLNFKAIVDGLGDVLFRCGHSAHHIHEGRTCAWAASRGMGGGRRALLKVLRQFPPSGQHERVAVKSGPAMLHCPTASHIGDAAEAHRPAPVLV